jgi:hypothetical protein
VLFLSENEKLDETRIEEFDKLWKQRFIRSFCSPSEQLRDTRGTVEWENIGKRKIQLPLQI